MAIAPSGTRVLGVFRRGAIFPQDEYARVASTFDAVVVMDVRHHVVGVQLAAGKKEVPAAVTEDIERFFDSLVSDSADKLGWS